MCEQRDNLTKEFIQNNLTFYPNADITVLNFIADFLYYGVPNVLLKTSSESIYSTFRAGYCYYFAVMLKEAFNRGTVCWAAPLGHIVWVDTDMTPYDIGGINFSEAEYFIPVEYLGNAINDFKHIPGIVYNCSADELKTIMEKYKKDTGCD